MLYFLSLAAIVFVSGVLIEHMFHWIINDPEGHISGVATALFFIVFTTGFKYFTLGMRQQYLLQEAEFKQVQIELSLLKSQLHPHFFFNTLNSLYALSLEKSEQVPGMILKLSDLMRYVLDCSKRKTVSLEEEIRFIANYVELEKLRLSGEPDIRFKAEGVIEGREIAPMLLIPFVENGFKHGLGATTREGYISIDAGFCNGRFQFIVENQKPAHPHRGEEGSGRIGLENVKRRLDLHYPDSYNMEIKEDENRYLVELSIVL